MTKTQREKVETYAALAERDGDPEAAATIRALLARATNAERERDEARATITRLIEGQATLTLRAELAEARRDKWDMGAIISETMTALESEPDDNMIGLARARVADLKRVEADNAALVDLLGRAGGVLRDMAGMPMEGDILLDAASEPHPGAALLAELEALRRVNAVLPPFINLAVHAAGGLSTLPHRPGTVTVEECSALRDACAAVDALKEPA